jgi:hypothetical protein
MSFSLCMAVRESCVPDPELTEELIAEGMAR